MDADTLLLLFAAMVGGTLNAVAGGGTFVTFPALTLLAGVPAVPANATSTVALWPGSLASVGAYRRELRDVRDLRLLVATSLAGGILGAALLLWLPSSVFERLVPFLLLLATILFAVNRPVARWLARRRGGGDAARGHSPALLALVQFAVAVYGGYFGGGIGIMMLAVFGLLELGTLIRMNAVKTILQAVINGVAVITFVVAGAVVWSYAAVMLVGSIVGGYGGASLARRIDERILRGFVIVTGLAMSALFFLR